MYERAAIPDPCPLCKNSMGFETLWCTAVYIPPLHIDTPENGMDPLRSDDTLYRLRHLRPPHLLVLPILPPIAVEQGGQKGHQAAGFAVLVHFSDCFPPFLVIMAFIHRIVHTAGVVPRNIQGKGLFSWYLVSVS